jgi:murein DD-endopeptidase MepM/ murein hydrolase activator NlpD
MHTGVDLIVPSGTPVLAARSGHVVLAEWVSGYGLTVLLDHGDGWQTLYAHLEGMEVRAGGPIARGERLGRVGDTGRASTPHRHLELRRRGEGGVMAVNPAALLEAPRFIGPVLAAGPVN